MNDIVEMRSIAKNLNQFTFISYYEQLKLIALSRVKYKNLPNHIKEEWIERYLFSEGYCMFFNDDTLGLMVTKCNREGLNPYDEPTDLRPIATNYQNTKTYKNGVDCVFMKNNDMATATRLLVQLFAYRLSELTRTIDVNVKAQKTPILIKVRDKQRLTLKNVYTQYEGNEPVIFEDKNAELGNFEVIKTDAPIVFDKLQLQKHQVMNEFLTMMGINNANQDKKERLVDDEVQANNEIVEVYFESMFKARQQAVEEINRLFGTNIEVCKRVENEVDFEGSEKKDEKSDPGSEVA